MNMLEFESVRVDIPEGMNVIIGQSHFIKTIEDVYEAMVNTIPGIKFGVAFCEASADRLIRWDGTDDEAVECAKKAAADIAAGIRPRLLRVDLGEVEDAAAAFAGEDVGLFVQRAK